MSKYNVDLMLAVREQITSHPETHYQGAWGRKDPECGTTHCIAGWAAVLSGEQLRWEADRAWRCESGGWVDVLARQLLGLRDEEAESLFFTMNEESALRQLDELIEKGKNQS